MLADFFTKPLQGSKFVKFRNQILNLNLPSSFGNDRLTDRLTSQECVGKPPSNVRSLPVAGNSVSNPDEKSGRRANLHDKDDVTYGTRRDERPLANHKSCDVSHRDPTLAIIEKGMRTNARSYLSVARCGLMNKRSLYSTNQLVSLK